MLEVSSHQLWGRCPLRPSVTQSRHFQQQILATGPHLGRFTLSQTAIQLSLLQILPQRLSLSVYVLPVSFVWQAGSRQASWVKRPSLYFLVRVHSTPVLAAAPIAAATHLALSSHSQSSTPGVRSFSSLHFNGCLRNSERAARQVHSKMRTLSLRT